MMSPNQRILTAISSAASSQREGTADGIAMAMCDNLGRSLSKPIWSIINRGLISVFALAHQLGVQMPIQPSDLLAHAEWANAVFFNAWGKSPARDHEEMRQRVGHILGVQQGFLSILRGEAPGGPPGGPPPSFD